MRRFVRHLATAAVLCILCLLPLTAEASVVPADTMSSEVALVHLEVSLRDRVLSVTLGDSLLASYTVAVGKKAYPTPEGSFHITRIIWNPSWVPPKSPWARGKSAKGPGEPGNPMGRAKIFFAEPDYYLHGTNDEESLGSAASHGCVRMRNEDIVELARLLMEFGGEARPSTWYDTVLVRRTQSREVRLSAPVRIQIHRDEAALATS